MTQQITGGVVRFERNIKTADYEGAKASVELSFNVEEGQDAQAVIDSVSALAKSKALDLLSKKAAAPAAPAAPARTKADLEAEKKAELESKAPKTAKPPKLAKPAGAPLVNDVVIDEPKQAIQTGDERVEIEEGVEDLAGPTPVTDADLTGAITRKNEKIKNPVKIRALIAEYVPGPADVKKHSHSIPQEKRQEFLKALDALTA